METIKTWQERATEAGDFPASCGDNLIPQEAALEAQAESPKGNLANQADAAPVGVSGLDANRCPGYDKSWGEGGGVYEKDGGPFILRSDAQEIMDEFKSELAQRAGSEAVPEIIDSLGNTWRLGLRAEDSKCDAEFCGRYILAIAGVGTTHVIVKNTYTKRHYIRGHSDIVLKPIFPANSDTAKKMEPQ